MRILSKICIISNNWNSSKNPAHGSEESQLLTYLKEAGDPCEMNHQKLLSEFA